MPNTIQKGSDKCEHDWKEEKLDWEYQVDENGKMHKKIYSYLICRKCKRPAKVEVETL